MTIIQIKLSFNAGYMLVNPYHQVSFRQHCHLSICSYFGWAWQILNLKRAGPLRVSQLLERPFATDYILMNTLGKIMVTSKHIVNSSASTHDQQSKWSKGHQPYGMTRHDPIWHAGMIWWAVADTRSISQWNIDSEQRKPPCCCSKAVPTSDGGDPTIPSADHMS